MKKRSFLFFDENHPGPYYDPYDSHIHNWVSTGKIKNFQGEQNPHKEETFKKMIPFKNGLYCKICHARKSGIISGSPVKNKFKEVDFSNNPIPEIKIFTKTPQIKEYILYDLNYNETKLVPKRELTYYQKFKLNNRDYRINNPLFIVNTTFNYDYYVISDD